MKGIEVVPISKDEVEKILSFSEGHFRDFKSLEVAPAKLTKTLSGLANAEGGEVFIGIEDARRSGVKEWRGFQDVEAANGFIQAFEDLFPLGNDCAYSFLRSEGFLGLVLKVEIGKSRSIKASSDGKVYVRRGAQNLPVLTEEALTILKQNKGIVSFETNIVNTDPSEITNSSHIIKFMLEVVPFAEPEIWLKKQQLLVDGRPTVAGTVLFAEEPQALLPKRCGIKIYRYKTSDPEGTRETLDGNPISVEGCAYVQIKESVKITTRIVESVRTNTPEGLQEITYPATALHEIITNGVLHRDYFVTDDIHIKIFDNRIEVASPGTLPGHVTVENILNERFARNPTIVRLINKFPDPPNKDVGEGLNTAFQAMHELKLKAPYIEQSNGYVIVTLKHEPLASPEELVLEYLNSHESIMNKQAREICFIGSENKMKTILQRMVKNNLIELVPGTTRYNAAYKLKPKGSNSQ